MNTHIKIEGLHKSFIIDSTTLQVVKGIDMEIKRVR